MEQINKLLKSIGLTETESNIYLAGLSYPNISVNELEKQTNIKRTTIYQALNSLIRKGLVSKKGTESRLVFNMTSPENIQRMLDKKIDKLKSQKKELDEVIPLLNQRITQQEKDINVLHYEGIEGMKLVVEEALYCKSGHWDIIAPRKNFFRDFSPEYAKYFLSTRKQKKITARSLWESDFTKRILTPEEIKARNPRFLPKIMEGKFKSVIILFDDKVALISSLKQLSAILIHSKEIHDTFFAMFEGLWATSENYLKK